MVVTASFLLVLIFIFLVTLTVKGFLNHYYDSYLEFGVLKVKNLSTYKFQEETAPSDDVIDRSATSIVLAPEMLNALKIGKTIIILNNIIQLSNESTLMYQSDYSI